MMPSTVAQEMERWDPHAIRWRLQAYRRLAAESVLQLVSQRPKPAVADQGAGQLHQPEVDVGAAFIPGA